MLTLSVVEESGTNHFADIIYGVICVLFCMVTAFVVTPQSHTLNSTKASSGNKILMDSEGFCIGFFGFDKLHDMT